MQLRRQPTDRPRVAKNERPPAVTGRLGVGAEPRPERLPGRGVEGLQLQQHTIRRPERWANGSRWLMRLAHLWILGGRRGREVLAHRESGRCRKGDRRVLHGQPAQPPHHHGQRALRRQLATVAQRTEPYRLHSTSRAAVYRHQPEHRLRAHSSYGPSGSTRHPCTELVALPCAPTTCRPIPGGASNNGSTRSEHRRSPPPVASAAACPRRAGTRPDQLRVGRTEHPVRAHRDHVRDLWPPAMGGRCQRGATESALQSLPIYTTWSSV